jgi:hypothetical protein
MSIGSKYVWILYLNDMRMPHFEDLRPVVRADSMNELYALIDREKVAPYSDVSGLPEFSEETEPSISDYRCNSREWGKVFRKGGPLEWYNPPTDIDRSFRFVPRVVDYSDEIDLLVEARTI